MGNDSCNDGKLATKVKDNIDDTTMRDWAEELVPSKDKVAPEERDGA